MGVGVQWPEPAQRVDVSNRAPESDLHRQLSSVERVLTDARIDILYVITDLKLGGVPLHLHRLARAMRDRGWRPAVVALGELGPVASLLTADGIPVETCGACCGGDVRVIGRLARVIRERRPHLVHAMLFHANLAARLASQAVGFPWQQLLCEIQTVEVERPWHLQVERFTHGLSRLTIGNSPSVIQHLAERAGVPASRLRLIRGGVDPEPILAAEPIDKRALGLSDGDAMLLWVGRLDPVKGLIGLLTAFDRAARDRRLHLVLVGDGPLRDELLWRVAKMPCASRVHLLGARRDVAPLLRACDAFVFPSRTEGLPNALLEAMAAGCPIVTTDVPGCRDLIRDAVTGLVVSYGDTLALGTAIARLVDDRRLATRLGEAAARSVSTSWHLSATHRAYADLYGEVGDTGGRAVAP